MGGVSNAENPFFGLTSWVGYHTQKTLFWADVMGAVSHAENPFFGLTSWVGYHMQKTPFSGSKTLKMPATRSYEEILKDADECLEKLGDEWEQVQTNRLKGKKEEFRKLMKTRMDLIRRRVH